MCCTAKEYLVEETLADELEEKGVGPLEQDLKVVDVGDVLDDGRVELEGQVEVAVDGVAEVDEPPQPLLVRVAGGRSGQAALQLLAPHLLQPLVACLAEQAGQLVLHPVAEREAVLEGTHVEDAEEQLEHTVQLGEALAVLGHGKGAAHVPK